MQMNSLMNMMNNSVLETGLALLRRNAESIVRAIPAGTKLLPVLKCDAYGLGAAEIARVLEPLEAVVGFAVAHVSEGLALLNACITKDILVMSSALPWQLSAAVEANLTLACGRAGFASELQAAAEAAGKPAAIHIKIDTGLHRIGFAPEELGGLLEELKNAPSLRVTGTFSHFSDPSRARRRASNTRNTALTRCASGGGCSWMLRRLRAAISLKYQRGGAS